jgi:prevent-host-death family protein
MTNDQRGRSREKNWCFHHMFPTASSTRLFGLLRIDGRPLSASPCASKPKKSGVHLSQCILRMLFKAGFWDGLRFGAGGGLHSSAADLFWKALQRHGFQERRIERPCRRPAARQRAAFIPIEAFELTAGICDAPLMINCLLAMQRLHTLRRAGPNHLTATCSNRSANRSATDSPFRRRAGLSGSVGLNIDVDVLFWMPQIRPIDLTSQTVGNFVREIQASEAKARLPSLLDAVERGETVIITRHGRPIARIVPEVDLRQAEFDRVIAEIEEVRGTMPSIPLEELLSARHEGHEY